MKAGRILLIFKTVLIACWVSFHCGAQPSATNSVDETTVKAERDAAVHQVEKIVNQLVTAYRRVPGMKVSKFEGGWFHAGALRPDFNNVDVRKTRDTSVYEKAAQYVTSDLNPGLAWLGKDLEFNAMTKQFYTNRNLPKKKLTEAEMVEINRLYRIIGDCEKKLLHQENVQQVAAAKVGDSTSTASGSADSTSTETKRPRLLNAYLGGAAVLFLVAILIAKSLLKK